MASRSCCRRVTDAADQGVGIIFQELNLCTNLTVLDNLFLAQEIDPRPGHRPRVRSASWRRELLERLGQDIDPDELVSNLRVGQQQIVEIAKALTHDVRVLIMDEPTSALSQAEVEGLFRIIDDLKARWRGHRLHQPQARGAAAGRRPHHRHARWQDRGPRRGRRRRRGLDHRADGGPLPSLALQPHRARTGRDAPRGQGRDAAASSAADTSSTTSRSRSTPARSWASTDSWAPGAPNSWRSSPGVRPEASGEVLLEGEDLADASCRRPHRRRRRPGAGRPQDRRPGADLVGRSQHGPGQPASATSNRFYLSGAQGARRGGRHDRRPVGPSGRPQEQPSTLSAAATSRRSSWPRAC